MATNDLRRAFMIFHAVLGGALLIMGHNALFHALHAHGVGHLALVATLQITGAIMLLIPRTIKWGGTALLVILVPGFIMPVAHGNWELQFLIYAAGVWFVMVHGAEWGRGKQPA